jgi:hypothetical protein
LAPDCPWVRGEPEQVADGSTAWRELDDFSADGSDGRGRSRPRARGRHHRVTRVSYDQHARTPSASRGARLRQDVPGYIPVHIGQAEISAGVVVGEAFVVEAHEVQDGGVPIVDG